MADRILTAVAIQRDIVSGAEVQTDLHDLIASYARLSLYRRPGPTVERLRKKILRKTVRKYFPLARDAGVESANPILERLGDAKLTTKGQFRRGPILRGLRQDQRRNLEHLRAVLKRETGTLKAEIEVAFARAQRDGVARKNLVRALVEADKGEMKRIATVREEIARTGNRLEAAERRLGKASNRKQRRARRDLKQAKAAYRKANAKMRTAKTFFARFETKVQGEIRDATRREMQEAQYAAFRERGYRTFTWVAVNGTDACPDCSGRHGITQSEREWKRQGMPGDGATVCGASCMCMMVPAEYVKGNPSLATPLKRSDAPVAAPKDYRTGTTRPRKEIKVGGANADLAKRAKKRKQGR